MNIDQAREYVVVVNGGSGCIIQPMTNQYMYLLTAKHNLTENNRVLEKIICFKLAETNWVKHEITIPSLIENVNYFPHTAKDIAIIKIPYDEYFNKGFRFGRLTEDKNDYNLLGYPGIRRGENPHDETQWYRLDRSIQICDNKGNGLFEAGIPGNPDLNEVKGDSGGAIVKIIEETLYIAGIQNKMASKDEQLGRIQFTSIDSFDEIINLNKINLAPILPCYLKSFSFLKNEAFNLNAGLYQTNIDFVKNFLNFKTSEIIKCPITPNCIKDLFNRRLLIYQQKSEVLYSKSIWLIWLEFLTILNVLKNESFTKESIEDIFNSIRLIYTDTEKDWSSELTNIAYSDFKGLKKNGVVIIGLKNPPYTEDGYILNKKIPYISQIQKTADRNLFQIDEGINFPLNEFKFIHIEYFKKQAIVNKHSEYAEILDDDSLYEKLKKEYNILLEHE